jgi:hypothetical protein
VLKDLYRKTIINQRKAQFSRYNGGRQSKLFCAEAGVHKVGRVEVRSLTVKPLLDIFSQLSPA